MGGFFPAGTSNGMVPRLFRDAQALLDGPEVRPQLEAVGIAVDPGESPDAFMGLVRTDAGKGTKVVREGNIRVN